MTAIARNIGFGTKLGVDIAGGTTFVDLVSIKTPPNGPNAKIEKVDVSLLNEKWKSSAGGQGDAGEVTFDIQYDKTDTVTTQILTTLLGNSNVANWQVTYALPSMTTGQFLGWVGGFDKKTSLTEAQEATLTINVNGAPGV